MSSRPNQVGTGLLSVYLGRGGGGGVALPWVLWDCPCVDCKHAVLPSPQYCMLFTNTHVGSPLEAGMPAIVIVIVV